MTERSKFMMAALTSATMPNAAIAGTRASEQTNSTDKGYGVDHAVVQDTAGKLYDVFASNTPEGASVLPAVCVRLKRWRKPANWVDWGLLSIT